MRAGIPTSYAGVRFRSRLEATWAAFFDLMRWRWTYEPLDLGGYIPDFTVRACAEIMRCGVPDVVFEVKPTFEDFDRAISKVSSSGWRGGYVIVGPSLPMRSDIGVLDKSSPDWLALGVAGLCAGTIEAAGPGLVGFGNCDHCNRFFPCLRKRGAGPCQLCGGTTDHNEPDAGAIRLLFAAAKNRVQWNGEFGV